MRLIDADAAKKQINQMQTLKASERNLLRLAVDRTPTYEMPNDSLTLEQLQKMDGEPVWIESKTGQYGKYWLTQSDSGIVSFRNGYGYCFRYEVVTTQWGSKIYRRKPEETEL